LAQTRVTVFALFLAALAAGAAPTNDLKYVVIVTRHGVRAPTWTAEELNEYAAEPWPKWNVKPGELTEHGRLLIKLFGAYYRADFARQGLLSLTGCADANRVYVWADTGQRTLETGRVLAESILPGCHLKIHSVPEDEPDPIFSPLGCHIGKPNRELALAAVMGRVGEHPEDLVNVYAPALRELQRILEGSAKASKSLFDSPGSIIAGKGDNLVDVTGALRTGSTLTQNLLLEFTDGRKGHELGWGRLNAGNLRQIMAIHTAYADLARRTPYLARVRGSNLLFHVLASLEQAVTSSQAPGAMGPPDTRVLILTGHDANLSNLSGMLGVNWLLPGYQPDDAPPGGALVFELRKRGQEQPRIRTYYTAQSLEQMQDAKLLSLESPPLRAPVFLPGCSRPGKDFECTWGGFRAAVEAAIDHEFVKP
jgi:4-phytase/acid phosphatase